MGFTPAQVDTMSIWQFRAAALGVSRVNGATIEDSLSPEHVDEMAEFLERPPIWETQA